MSDRDALLAAVLADPDADLPRLVFADHLDESGHPADAARAAFIRLQVEAEGHPAHSPERAALLTQARDLRPAFRDEWDAVAPPDGFPDAVAIRRRGFVDEVQTTVRRLRLSGPGVFAVAPVRALRVSYSPGTAPFAREWATFAGSAYLTGVQALDFGPRLWHLVTRHEPLVEVTGCPHLTAVRRLGLAGNSLDDGFVVRFISLFPGAGFAGSVREVDLSDNAVTDAGAHALAAARGVDGLSRLDLTRNRVGPAGAARLRRRFGDRVQV